MIVVVVVNCSSSSHCYHIVVVKMQSGKIQTGFQPLSPRQQSTVFGQTGSCHAISCANYSNKHNNVANAIVFALLRRSSYK